MTSYNSLLINRIVVTPRRAKITWLVVLLSLQDGPCICDFLFCRIWDILTDHLLCSQTKYHSQVFIPSVGIKSYKPRECLRWISEGMC